MTDNSAPSRNNLNFFYTLDAILNAQTLTEAARLTHLTQPAISMALKKARAHFNDDIVTYVGGKRQLTALAIALRPRIRRSLRDAQQILDLTLDFDPANDRRTIRITMPDFVEIMFLPHVLRAVRAAAPNIDLSIVPFDYWPAERQFEKDVDFVFLPAPLVDAAYGAMPLYEEGLCVMVAKAHAMKLDPLDLGLITLEQYRNGVHAALFDMVEVLAPAQGPVADLLASRNIVARTGLYAALPRVIVDTDLIVTTSSRYAQYCTSIMEVQCLTLPVRSEDVMIHTQWQPFREQEPLVRWFSRILMEATAFI